MADLDPDRAAGLDRILADDPAAIARGAGAAARRPSFETVARRGRRRRGRRQAAYLGAVAVAVAGILGAVQLLDTGGGRTSPAPTAPTTTPIQAPTSAPTDAATDATDVPTDPPTATTADLAAIVDADDAILTDLAVTPDRPDVRATVWSPTGEGGWVLALTGDGFAHRRLLEVPRGSSVQPAGDGRFVLRRAWEGHRLDLVDVAGVVTPVDIARDPAPVAAGEVPVVLSDGVSTVLAVAPDGTAHPVPTPNGIRDLAAFGGRLVGTTWADDVLTYHWSDDGGASWRQAEIAGSFLPAVAAAPTGGLHVVLEGGDGATVFPLLAVDAAADGDAPAWTRHEVERGEDRWPTLNGAWVGRDGRPRVLASYYDKRGRQPVDSGVFTIDDGRLTKVASDHPEVSDVLQWTLIETYDDGPVLWIPGTGGEVWRSADDGATWTSSAAR